MTDARDELVDVIAKAMHEAWAKDVVNGPAPKTLEEMHPRVQEGVRKDAVAIVVALVERYGEPEIETLPDCSDSDHCHQEMDPVRRLVFPWQAVGESA